MEELIVITLAVWRICFMLANEDLFKWFRELVGVRADPDGQVYGLNWFAKQVTCVWCTSIPIGLLFVVAYLLWPRQTFLVSLPFAISAGAIMVHMSRPIQRWYG